MQKVTNEQIYQAKQDTLQIKIKYVILSWLASWRISRTKEPVLQGSFCAHAPPMRDDATLKRRLSLAGFIHKIIPGLVKS